MRPLFLLLAIVLTLSASGLSVVFADTGGGDDCCGETEREPTPDRPEPGAPDDCPPFCHSCACAPLFEQPRAVAIESVTLAPALPSLFLLAHAPPPGPPGPGVFHPPR